MAATPTYPGALGSAGVTIVNADGTSLKTLFTAGASGAIIDAVSDATDDTATADLQLWMTIGAVTILLGTKQSAITAGFIDGTGASNLFDGIRMPFLPINKDGQRHLKMPPNAVLKVGAKVAVTAAKTHYIFASGYQI